jgi:hypothetical protein
MSFDVFLALVVQIADFCIVLKEDTDVSEEYVASIFRVWYLPTRLNGLANQNTTIRDYISIY